MTNLVVFEFQAIGRAKTRIRDDNDHNIPAIADEHDARKKMYAKMKSLGGSSEFNLG